MEKRQPSCEPPGARSFTRTPVPTEGEVEPGVHRLGSRRVDWYVLEDGGRYTVVDAGLPTHYAQWDVRTGRATDPILPAVLADGRGAFESLGPVTLLSGHGDPWRGERCSPVGVDRRLRPPSDDGSDHTHPGTAAFGPVCHKPLFTLT